MGASFIMEYQDMLRAIAFGVVGGMWVVICNIGFARRQWTLSWVLSLLSPSIIWFVVTISFLTVHTPNDVLGMHMLTTGLIVLLLSCIGVVVRRIIPRIRGGHIVVITLVLSIVIQLLWMYSITLNQHTP